MPSATKSVNPGRKKKETVIERLLQSQVTEFGLNRNLQYRESPCWKAPTGDQARSYVKLLAECQTSHSQMYSLQLSAMSMRCRSQQSSIASILQPTGLNRIVISTQTLKEVPTTFSSCEKHTSLRTIGPSPTPSLTE